MWRPSMWMTWWWYVVGAVVVVGGPGFIVSIVIAVAPFVVVVAVICVVTMDAHRDVALACDWVLISQHEGWRRRHTYLGSW